jgi:hypothetical protein
MRGQKRHGGVAALTTLGTLAFVMLERVPQAHAHISLEQGGTHKSRYGDGVLKDGPCGMANGVRGTNVYTYQPGETITITLAEYVAHPSYFRIAFDDDGDDAFVDPKSIKPIDPTRGCPYALGVTNDHCDASDFYNNAAVLPNMDNLNPHVSAASGTKYTWQVTLPNVECANCTLQIIQVMEDPFGHGPYDNVSDVYHQCIDLVLTRGAGTMMGAAGTGAGAAGSTAPWPGVAGTGAMPEAGAGAGAAGGGAEPSGIPNGAAGSGGMPSGTWGGAGMGGTLMEGLTGGSRGKPAASCSASLDGHHTGRSWPALAFAVTITALARARRKRS